MIRRVIGALLAAAAFLPVAAEAQWRGGNDSPRPYRGGRGEAAAAPPRDGSGVYASQRPERPQFSGRVRDRFPDGDVTVHRSTPDAYGGRRDWQRSADGRRPDGAWGGPLRDPAPGPDVAQDGSRFDGRSRLDTRSRIDTRSRFDDRSYGGRFDDRRYRDRYAYRGGDDAGRWNRDWRGDDRYAWSRYRATNRAAFRLQRYYAPYDWNYGYRRFSIGVTLSSALWGEDYWIDDPYAYRLPDAYELYRWVRYYNDALLVDLRTGLVVDTVYDMFY